MADQVVDTIVRRVVDHMWFVAKSLITFGSSRKSNAWNNEGILSYSVRQSVAVQHAPAARHTAYTPRMQRHTADTQGYAKDDHTNAHHHTETLSRVC